MEPGVYLYEHIDFGGRCVRLDHSEPDLRGLFNDLVSSIRIVGPLRATFYEHAGYHGARSTGVGSPWGSRDYYDVRYPFKYTHGVYDKYWCPWEFTSPTEIANDQASSVYITDVSRYDMSSRLVSPAGSWSKVYSADTGIAGVETFEFKPDGSYSHVLTSPTVGFARSGTFTLHHHYFDIDNPLRSFSGDSLHLTEGHLRYRFVVGSDAIEVLFPETGWIRFSFDAGSPYTQRAWRVTAITESAGRISQLSGRTTDGAPWQFSVGDVIATMSLGTRFFVEEPAGDPVDLVVARTDTGRQYVKTRADGDEPNNLLSLPRVPTA